MNFRRWQVVFPLDPPYTHEGVVVSEYRPKIAAWTWEQAVLKAAALAPEVIAGRVLESVRASTYTVETL